MAWNTDGVDAGIHEVVILVRSSDGRGHLMDGGEINVPNCMRLNEDSVHTGTLGFDSSWYIYTADNKDAYVNFVGISDDIKVTIYDEYGNPIGTNDVESTDFEVARGRCQDTEAISEETGIPGVMNTYYLKSSNGESYIVFTEPDTLDRQTFTKYIVPDNCDIIIGRDDNTHICFDKSYVSGAHAKLSCGTNGWSITDLDSVNGTYLNNERITTSALHLGDVIFIMGLRIVIGPGMISVNNPDGSLYLSSALNKYSSEEFIASDDEYEIYITGNELKVNLLDHYYQITSNRYRRILCKDFQNI